MQAFAPKWARSAAGAQQGAFAFLGPDAALRDPKREAAVAASGIPHTVVRAARVRDAPGGGSQLRFGALSRDGGGEGGEIRQVTALKAACRATGQTTTCAPKCSRKAADVGHGRVGAE